MDLLSLVRRLPGCPPLFNEQLVARFVGDSEIHDGGHFSEPVFARALYDSDTGKRKPQAIAHRGFRAKYAENSLRAFKEAVRAGAQAIETDLHLTADDEVVLSHDVLVDQTVSQDSDLKRCFAVDRKIRDCDWEFLQTLRSNGKDSEPLASLRQLLELLVQPEMDHVWLMLDIKMDDNAADLVSAMAKAFAQVLPLSRRPWESRVILGYWTARYIPLLEQHFPMFPVSNIGFSIPYSERFLAVSQSGFTMFQASLVSLHGRKFLSKVRERERVLFSWTVDDERNMQWCMERGIDGMVVDDIDKFHEVWNRLRQGQQYSWSWITVRKFLSLNFWIFLWSLVISWQFGIH